MAEIALAHFIGSDVERAGQRSDMLERRREMMAARKPALENASSRIQTFAMSQLSHPARAGAQCFGPVMSSDGFQKAVVEHGEIDSF